MGRLKKQNPPAKENVPNEVSDNDRIEVTNRIEQIGWLFVSVGLQRVGGEWEMYEDILELTINEISKTRQKLSQFLIEGDMRSFCVVAHGIKNSLAVIGAVELEEEALALEKASGRNDIVSCALDLPQYLDNLENLQQSLEEIFCDTPFRERIAKHIA